MKLTRHPADTRPSSADWIEPADTSIDWGCELYDPDGERVGDGNGHPPPKRWRWPWVLDALIAGRSQPPWRSKLTSRAPSTPQKPAGCPDDWGTYFAGTSREARRRGCFYLIKASRAMLFSH